MLTKTCSGCKPVYEVWSLLLKTLPENNREFIAREISKIPLAHGIKLGDVWELSCKAKYKWPKDDPFYWEEAERICSACDSAELKFDEETGIFLNCSRCGDSHFYDEPHQSDEQAELRDRWARATGKEVSLIPALKGSSFDQWPAEQVATTIVKCLEICPNAGESRRQLQLLKTANDAFLTAKDIIPRIAEELKYSSSYGSSRIALTSMSTVLFSTFNDRDVFIKKLGLDEFAFQMVYTDGADRTPTILIDGKDTK